MAFDGTDSTIHAVIYIVLSIFTDLKLECNLSALSVYPICGSKLGDYQLGLVSLFIHGSYCHIFKRIFTAL